MNDLFPGFPADFFDHARRDEIPIVAVIKLCAGRMARPVLQDFGGEGAPAFPGSQFRVTSIVYGDIRQIAR